MMPSLLSVPPVKLAFSAIVSVCPASMDLMPEPTKLPLTDTLCSTSSGPLTDRSPTTFTVVTKRIACEKVTVPVVNTELAVTPNSRSGTFGDEAKMFGAALRSAPLRK